VRHHRLVLFAVLSRVLLFGPLANAQSAPSPQPPAAPTQSNTSAASADSRKGGVLHGHIKSGPVPMPGVSITATNTLTGKKYTTTTDVTGAFAMSIPQNGRYVLKTDLAAFAPVTKEALLNATSHDQTVDFEIVLASRAEQATQQEARSTRQYSGTGAQALNLANALSGALDASANNGGALGSTGAQLPTLAGNNDFSSNDSVTVSGQAGVTNPFAGINTDQLREDLEDRQQQQSLSQTPGQNSDSGRGAGGAGFGGGGGFGGGRIISLGPGGGGGRLGNFRHFRPDQPHGAFFWNGGNSALNALPFSLQGQPIDQPPYNSNNFGLTLIGEPFIPKLTKPSTKDTVFFTLSGQRTSAPVQTQYANVPTSAERNGDFSGLISKDGTQIPIYDPTTGAQFPGNAIPQERISQQARALLNYLPPPNLPGATQNYFLLQTQETNTTQLGTRYIRTIGNNGGGQRLPAFLTQFSNQKGLRQNVNLNFNYTHNASDNVTIFPQLGGKTFSNGYSLQTGYTIGYGRLTNNFSVGWNRSDGETTNFFTNSQDIATQLGIHDFSGQAITSNPLNYGLPNIVLSQFTGLSETQPSVRIQQTISFSESSSWRHGKHNFRFGADYRRIHLDMLSSPNTTGTFYFTGYNTQNPNTRNQTSGQTSSTVSSGSDFADLLLGLPQETTIQAPLQKAYTRANAWDIFAQDDFRARSNLTLLYGLRYEYFSPYAEKYDHLAMLQPLNNFTSVTSVLPNAPGFPHTLIYPYRLGFSPRLGFALRAMKDTVIRGGYGINYTNAQYGTIIRSLVYQPPFANVQTNEQTSGANISLANGLAPANSTHTLLPTFSVNPHYKLPNVQVWNLDVQRTMPWGIVLNVGYNGAKGTHLDITTAPRDPSTGDPIGGVFFNYEDAPGFSNFNAATVRLRKRLQKGVSLGATYTYSHGIDNAGSIGGTSTIVAQNWLDLRAEEGNSSFDQRHKVNGDYTFELPFGPDKAYLNNGNWASHAFSNILVTGSFGFATGIPLNPTYTASSADVARGTAGSLRPDRVLGTSVTAGSGSRYQWFNTTAFTVPIAPCPVSVTPCPVSTPPVYGSASRNSIPGPGTISNNMSLSKTVQMGETRSFEMRATATNVFNTIQYSGVNSSIDSRAAGQVTSVANTRQFTFLARYRF
jgi:trimeric autotransporter adhesin